MPFAQHCAEGIYYLIEYHKGRNNPLETLDTASL